MKRKMTMKEIESESKRFDVIFPLDEEEEGLDMNEEVYNLSVHIINSALIYINTCLNDKDIEEFVYSEINRACWLFDEQMKILYTDKWWHTYDTIGSVIKSIWISWPKEEE